MYELIEHRRLDSAVSSITFSNIPQDGSDLLVVGSFRFDRATRDTPVRMLLNGAGFTARNLFGYPTSVGSQSPTTNYIGWAPGATSTANIFGNFSVLISNYTSTGAKSFSVDIIQEDNQAGAFLTITAGLSSTTAAITTVAFSDEAIGANLVAGSSATLYKVNRTAGIGAPKAIGGNITYANGYWVHTFTGSGTFYSLSDLSVEYVVVAGGGGAGWFGGGGGGGYRAAVAAELSGALSAAETPLMVSARTAISVEIGAGGTAGNNGTSGGSGVNSAFGNIVSTGGGGGGGTNINGSAGGSGGGGGGNSALNGSTTGGAGTTSQGFAGGNGGAQGGANGSGSPSGGGGGAGAAGQSSSVRGTNLPGNGGDGISSSITGTATFRAGGGAAGSFNQHGVATAGLGGGGTANTGGGGSMTAMNAQGLPGGSGIVIVRYRA